GVELALGGVSDRPYRPDRLSGRMEWDHQRLGDRWLDVGGKGKVPLGIAEEQDGVPLDRGPAQAPVRGHHGAAVLGKTPGDGVPAADAPTPVVRLQDTDAGGICPAERQSVVHQLLENCFRAGRYLLGQGGESLGLPLVVRWPGRAALEFLGNQHLLRADSGGIDLAFVAHSPVLLRGLWRISRTSAASGEYAPPRRRPGWEKGRSRLSCPARPSPFLCFSRRPPAVKPPLQSSPPRLRSALVQVPAAPTRSVSEDPRVPNGIEWIW